jgi:uncharacterized protein (DUF2237 family)
MEKAEARTCDRIVEGAAGRAASSRASPHARVHGSTCDARTRVTAVRNICSVLTHSYALASSAPFCVCDRVGVQIRPPPSAPRRLSSILVSMPRTLVLLVATLLCGAYIASLHAAAADAMSTPVRAYTTPTDAVEGAASAEGAFVTTSSHSFVATQEPHPTLRNVLGTPLESWGSSTLPTGYHRDNYCRVSPGDAGNHSVASVVTDDFLAYSASQGNDLRRILKAGDQWCLCSGRWAQALAAGHAPPVVLESTSEAAFGRAKLQELQAHAYKSAM